MVRRGYIYIALSQLSQELRTARLPTAKDTYDNRPINIIIIIQNMGTLAVYTHVLIRNVNQSLIITFTMN